MSLHTLLQDIELIEVKDKEAIQKAVKFLDATKVIVEKSTGYMGNLEVFEGSTLADDNVTETPIIGCVLTFVKEQQNYLRVVSSRADRMGKEKERTHKLEKEMVFTVNRLTGKSSYFFLQEEGVVHPVTEAYKKTEWYSIMYTIAHALHRLLK